MKIAAPMVAPGINIVKGAKATETLGIKDILDMTKAIVDKLPAEIKTPDRALSPGKQVSEQERSGLLALHRFLDQVDLTQANLGLYRVPPIPAISAGCANITMKPGNLTFPM